MLRSTLSVLRTGRFSAVSPSCAVRVACDLVTSGHFFLFLLPSSFLWLLNEVKIRFVERDLLRELEASKGVRVGLH